MTHDMPALPPWSARGSADTWNAAIAAANGDDASIERRRRASVQTDFSIGKGVASLGRRKVQIVELHGALQLVGALAGKKYGRCVRVNPLNAGATVGRRRGEEIDDGCLVLGDHGRAPR